MRVIVALATLAVTANAVLYTTAAAHGWKNLGRASPETMKTFHVAMPMSDFAGLESTLNAISDPYNPRYGQWLSIEQADAFTASPANIVKEVSAWATSTGATCERFAESLKCEANVSAIESLLSTELSTFGHTKRGVKIIRRSAPATVPASLEGKVLMVTGLSMFPTARLGNFRPIEAIQALGDADYAVVPQTLAIFYNVSFDGSAASSVGPIEFQAYPAYVPADLTTFLTDVAAPQYTIPASQIVGPFAPQEGAAESFLDEQYVGAMGQKNNQWYWTESDWLYEFAVAVGAAANTPSVMSISYAWYELDQCDISPGVAPCEGVPVPAGSVIFVNTVNALFAKIGARGISLISASGDSGAHGRTDPGCTSAPTRADFPAASPYVTSVGATEIADGTTGTVAAPICTGTLSCATGGREIVASNKVLAFFSSGGGFSSVSPRPSWQDAVVSKYLQNASAIPPAGDFNASNRGHPDVAALGHNYFIYMGGVSSVDGTSAATPVFSALIANINSLRLKAGKPVLGYLNPMLYALYASTPGAFNDVVQGDNSCTEDACPCPANTGYFAAPGWDAATGLGTPNYGAMVAGINNFPYA